MITVGLDFGTHQSKVCIEKKEGAELSYEFFRFKDADGKKQWHSCISPWQYNHVIQRS